VRKIKLFIFNFILSLLGYFVIILLSYFILGITAGAGEGFSSFPFWAKSIIYLHSLISASLCFLLGLKLKLLDEHLSGHALNYLSICGTVLLSLPLAYTRTYMFIFIALPFMGISLFSETIINITFEAQLVIVSFLPSLMTWLGMLYQSKNYNKSRAS